MNYYKLPGQVGANLHIRPGNRGGSALFDWQDIRSKRHIQRQAYLGASSKIGVLDKGGVFRKGDWWTKNQVKNQNNKQIFKQAKQAEKKRFKDAFKGSSVISSKRALNQDQINDLMKKCKQKDRYYEQQAQRVGLGYKQQNNQLLRLYDNKIRKRERSRQKQY